MPSEGVGLACCSHEGRGTDHVPFDSLKDRMTWMPKWTRGEDCSVTKSLVNQEAALFHNGSLRIVDLLLRGFTLPCNNPDELDHRPRIGVQPPIQVHSHNKKDALLPRAMRTTCSYLVKSGKAPQGPSTPVLRRTPFPLTA